MPDTAKYIDSTAYEYVWIDTDGGLRSKVEYNIGKLAPDSNQIVNFNGSSTGQATTNMSDVYLNPLKYYNNPFSDGYIVMCETLDKEGKTSSR